MCRTLGSLPNIARHYGSKLTMSDMPRYRSTILVSGPEILSIRNPVKNTSRHYIAGMDSLEAWDAQQMVRLGLEPQRIGPWPGRAESLHRLSAALLGPPLQPATPL